ncbi:hypothetical protein [Streptomyces sp. NPDC001340]
MNDDDAELRAMRIARQWAEVPPEHMRIALEALEPSLQRAHAERMERMRLQHARFGLSAGFALALVMLTGGVIVGVDGQLWLAGVLTGPSLLALTKVFVLNRSDIQDMKAISQVSQASPVADPGAVSGGTGVPQ